MNSKTTLNTPLNQSPVLSSNQGIEKNFDKKDNIGLLNANDIFSTWWQKVKGLGFALPQCQDCSKFHFYPQSSCPHCLGERIEPGVASGMGEIFSFSVVYRAPNKKFSQQLPYVIGIIKTQEGPHLMARLEGVAPDLVAIGMKVKVKASDQSSLETSTEQNSNIDLPVFELCETDFV